MRVVPCTVEHIRAVKVQSAQLGQDIRHRVNETWSPSLEKYARTFLADDGTVLGCIGVTPLWDGVGSAWAFLSEEILRQPLSLHKNVVHLLRDLEERDGYHRIEATVASNHDAGQRWLERLGFWCEGLLHSYGPDRADHYQYARFH